MQDDALNVGMEFMRPSTGILTIDLAAIQSNWRRVNEEIDSSKTCAAAVIKANAYGLGAEEVGLCLYESGCRDFFLATYEEAFTARQFLPLDARIFVLGGAPMGFETQCLQHRLTPVLFSLAEINRWQVACKAHKRIGACAIKVNTGMTRLGLDLNEFSALLEDVSASFAHMQPILIMSHLACADEPSNPLNDLQLKNFLYTVDLCKNLLSGVRFSLANSSGIFLGKEWHFDLVRPGAALYGINPQPQKLSPMRAVVSLSLPVLQIRKLQEDACIGYGASIELQKSSILAVVAGGYADGLHRTIGRQASGVIGKCRVPTVGRISMDTTVFDVSAVNKEILLDENLMIEVLGAEFTVDEMAERTSALGYEVLTSLGPRYERHYLKTRRVD